MFGITGVSCPAADTEYCGWIIIHILAQPRDVYVQHRDKRVEVAAQMFLIRCEKILAFRKCIPDGIGGKIGALLRCDFRDCAAYSLKCTRTHFRNTFPAAVTAECGGRYFRRFGKLLCRAGKGVYIFIQSFAEFHRFAPFGLFSIIIYRSHKKEKRFIQTRSRNVN